ncbi:MAG: EndoU domain-containing protein [Anaplasma sp.]
MKVGRITAFLFIFCASLCLEVGACIAVSSAGGSASNADKYASVTSDNETKSAADLDGREGVVFSGNTQDCRNSSQEFYPFYKTENNSECRLPYAPPMNVFDTAVLGMCGDWGNHPSKSDFLAMLENVSIRRIVQRIYDELDHEVFTAGAGLELFKEELAELWSGESGIVHVFCGALSNEKLRGMHFYGRYLQAQNEQWAGRDYSHVEQINDWDFSPSMKYKTPGGEVKIRGMAEMAVDLSHADDLIIGATKAYKGMRPHLVQEGQRRCVYSDGEKQYILMARKDAIVTFYPVSIFNSTCASGQDTTQCDCMNYLEGDEWTLFESEETQH